ncbi:hypothetical protein IMZ68_02670 [Candidatus Bathyarchaeota archaeon]|nr:hypothetical protein [Candidatus Bathyarchaeota archaeon]
MPIIRSALNIGNSKAVTIPKSWLTNAEENPARNGRQHNHNPTTRF